MKLSVVIPAYNEARNIKNTVESIYNYCREHFPEHEIIIVTDGSRDNTAAIIEGMIKDIPTLELIAEEKNQGKGYAVKRGMLKAVGDISIFTDADNSTTIDHLGKMLPYLDQGYDVVIGSIAVKGHTVSEGSEPAWRRLFGKLGNLFIQIMAVPGIHDTQRGFKVFTAKATQDIFPKITIAGWGFDVEVLALARKFGYKIKEVPVQWENDPNSSVGLKAYFQVLLETTKVRWNLITGRYNQQPTTHN